MDPYVAALRRLVDAAKHGYKEVAAKADLNPQTVYQVYNGVQLPSGNPKGVGPEMRRKLTAAFPNWLSPQPIEMGVRLSIVDNETSSRSPTPNEIVLQVVDELEGAERSSREQTTTIPEYGTGGRMGEGGVMLRDQPGEIRGWEVTSEWLRKNVPNCTSPGNLAIVTGFGDSMRPLYNPGDPLLVDTGVKSVAFDAIYFFRVGDEGFIKRLQRIPGNGLVAISENSSYRDWTITPEMDFEVFGRVIKIWRGDDF